MQPDIKVKNNKIYVIGHCDNIVECAKLDLLCTLYGAKKSRGFAELDYNEKFLRDFKLINTVADFGACTGQCKGTCGDAQCGVCGNCGKNVCTGNCGHNCGGSCSGGCENSCTGTCDDQCDTTCDGTCEDSCDAGNCKSSCGGECSKNCTNGCYEDGGCRNGCLTSCVGQCKDSCDTGCKEGCQNTCKGKTCGSGCTGGCSGRICGTNCTSCASLSSCSTACDDGCTNSAVTTIATEVQNRLTSLSVDPLIKAQDLTNLETLIRSEMARRSKTPSSHTKETVGELFTADAMNLVLSDLSKMSYSFSNEVAGNLAYIEKIKAYMASGLELYKQIIRYGN